MPCTVDATPVSPIGCDTLMHMTKLISAVRSVGQDWRLAYSCVLTAYLTLRGVDVGKDCLFYGMPRVRRVRGAKIQIGDRCVIRSGSASNPFSRGAPTVLSAVARGALIALEDDVRASDAVIVARSSVRIGRGTFLGLECLITDTDAHPVCPQCRAERDVPGLASVEIGSECFIGMRAIVLKGVSLANGTCVAAGAVVSRSVGGPAVVAGNPAAQIRSGSQCEAHAAGVRPAHQEAQG